MEAADHTASASRFFGVVTNELRTSSLVMSSNKPFAEELDSSVSSRPSRQQINLEAALHDLESSFVRESHSARYASHVLDVHTASVDEEEDQDDDISSIGRSNHTATSSVWMLNEQEEHNLHPDCDLDSCSRSFSSGMVDLWKRPKPPVDQSVNLMDAKTAKYEETGQRPLSRESIKSGLESLRMPDAGAKGPSFVFPAPALERAEVKEASVRKERIRKSRRHPDDEPAQKWHQAKLVIVLACLLSVLISATILAVSTFHRSDTSQFEGEGVVTAVKSATKDEESTFISHHSTEGNGKDDSFATFEAAANVSSTEAIAANAKKKEAANGRAYEVTSKEIIFQPTIVLPAKTRTRALLAILLEFEVSHPEEILQSERQTAAYLAMKWIAIEDPAELSLPSRYYRPPHTAKMSRHHEVGSWKDDTFLIQQLLQRYVLAVFYFSLQPPSNATEELETDDVLAAENHQHFQKSWLSGDHVCHWRGVDCGTYRHDEKSGVSSFHMSNVVSVNLTRHNLKGSLPHEWLSGAALPDLTSIDLSHNHLYGTLPDLLVTGETGPLKITTSKGQYDLRYPRNHTFVSSFSADSELLHLDIAHNQFSGTIPPLLQQMKHCHHLFLNHNQFSGKLKSLLAPGVGYGKLEQFDVGNNLLTGLIPGSLANLSNLQLLSLESNFLSGSLPDIFDKLQGMVELHANDNILVGSLPVSLGQSKGIARLWLDHNEFSGRIPSSWETITALEILSVHHNVLTGELPTYLGSSMQQISDLTLQNNQLQGYIPSELGLCTNIKRLFLEENFFRGTPPESFGKLKQLEKLRLSGNRLTGTMPFSVCDLLDEKQLHYVSADCKSGHIECSCCNACF